MTMSEYLGTWLTTYIEPFRATNTVDCYKRAISKLPSGLMDSPLEGVDGLRLQGAINAEAKKHPRTGQLIYSVLHAAMARACKLRLLAMNPMEAVEKPRHKAKQAAVFSAAQMREYLQEARTSDCWPLFLLMATCGLRRGEALGLRWGDLSGDVLHVQRQRIDGHDAPLKSSASDRRLMLPAPISAELHRWPVRTVSGYIVDTWPKHLYTEHRRIISMRQLPTVTLHGLRHSMATACVADGVSIKILQAILGHSTYKLTADLYADHVGDVAYTAESLGRVCNSLFSW